MQIRGHRDYKKTFCMRIQGGGWDLGPAHAGRRRELCAWGLKEGTPPVESCPMYSLLGNPPQNLCIFPGLSRASRGFRNKK